MYYCVQFTDYNDGAIAGICFGVYNDPDEVDFSGTGTVFTTSIDPETNIFIDDPYEVYLGDISESFIRNSIRHEAYLILDCNYVSIF